MIPQTGGEVRMDFQGTDPCVTCGIKDVDEEVIIWKANNRFKKKNTPSDVKLPQRYWQCLILCILVLLLWLLDERTVIQTQIETKLHTKGYQRVLFKKKKKVYNLKHDLKLCFEKSLNSTTRETQGIRDNAPFVERVRQLSSVCVCFVCSLFFSPNLDTTQSLVWSILNACFPFQMAEEYIVFWKDTEVELPCKCCTTAWQR